MKIDGWKYYNHAMVTTGRPGTKVNLTPLENGQIWHGEGGYALFARWVSNFDCGFETEWWYCLKDNDYDINSINAKKRYRITRGRKCFDVKPINDEEYVEELVNVQCKALLEYPEKYRPNCSKEEIRHHIVDWTKKRHVVFGAFKKNSSELCGYALINEYEDYCFYVQQKVDPTCEKDEINAALVDGVILYYEDRIKNGYPLVDGQRNIVHETGFQDYLCRIFGFRKVYCRLNIKYRAWFGLIVRLLYPFRERITSHEGRLSHQIGGVLKMEKIRRSFN